MVRFEKGSDEAKAYMKSIREGRKKKESTQNQTESMINNVEPVETNPIETPKRRGRLVKGSIEAREYMAQIRSKKKS
jgi:hypothetical protein